jgi:hypothetical protein
MSALVVREDDGFNLPPLGREDGSAFGWFDTWNLGTTPDGKYLVDLSDWSARDMHEMLTKDYKAQQIEKVLALPVVSAEYHIVPGADSDNGEAKWLNDYWSTDEFAGGCRTPLSQIIGLMTSAFYFRRAYFEKVYAKGIGKFAGKIVYDDVAFRPQTTCRMMRDPKNGRYVGFEQEAYALGPNITSDPMKWPIQIMKNRAFVYTHGTRRDPLNGVSDMEVAFWAWKTKQKVLLLWFQFLQSVSLPRIVVKAGDQGVATQIAGEIARLKSSGVIPLAVTGGPDSVQIDALDVSGKGAEQFSQAITWLDQCATQAVLAGFLDLTNRGMPQDGAGSYALSKDASDFFLQSLEAKVHEMEEQVRQQLFAPLIRHNFGKDAIVPRLKFEPLNDIDKDKAVDLLKQAMAAPPGGPVPTTFIAMLAGQVATYLGMEGDEVREQFKKSFDAAAAQAQAKALAEVPGGGTPTGQQVAGIAGATAAAHQAIQAGVNPAKAHADARKAAGADAAHAKRAAKADSDRLALFTKHAKKAVEAKTNGEASLSTEDAGDIDLNGFNPAQTRGYHGRWSGGQGGGKGKPPAKGQKARQHPLTPAQQHAVLLKQKAQLTAEAAHLRNEIAAFHHHTSNLGVKGTHRGQATGHKAGPKNAGPVKGGKAPAVHSGHTGGTSLQAQVANLRHTVESLREELVTLQQRAAKRRRAANPVRGKGTS